MAATTTAADALLAASRANVVPSGAQHMGCATRAVHDVNASTDGMARRAAMRWCSLVRQAQSSTRPDTYRSSPVNVVMTEVGQGNNDG